MNQQQIELLNKMKKLVYSGKRRFVIRKDRDYLEDLNELGITEESAWNEHILYLNKNFYYPDSKPNYSKDEDVSLTFKKKINGKNAYIKIKLEKILNEETVCLSFHIDNKKGRNVK